MKISITTNNKVYSVEDELGFDCVGIDEAVEMFRGLLVCAGFHPCNVDDQFNSDYTWFTQEERDENMQGHLTHSNKFVSKWHEECLEERVQEFQDNLYKPD
jgi:Tat protein secretion system quality control protein TatD with DNase activity